MAEVVVTDAQGQVRVLEAPEGWRVMEVLRDYDMGVEGLCDGLCDCATCAVEVDPAWRDKLHPARDDELDKLDELPTLSAGTRLSCQIIVSQELDGLQIALPRD